MHRNRYVETLELLSDLELQRRYEREVPIANVPAELICMWFDDLDLDNLTLQEADAEIIRSFSEFYRARVPELPTSNGVQALHSCPEWLEIVDEAKKALAGMVAANI